MVATNNNNVFHPLKAATRLPNDWYDFKIPPNIETGENTVIDSSYSFKNYHSVKKIGLRAGKNVTFWRTTFAAEENGTIEVGDYSYIQNAFLVCAERISIGKYVMIAGGVTIVDSDFHPLSPAGRLEDTIALSPVGNRQKKQIAKAKPVIIGDDVWIGFNATILKGVTIGKGAIIQPGSVVISDVEEGAVMAGNPATKTGDTA